MDGATPLYIFIICMNFGIISALLTFEQLWAKQNNIESLQRGIKVGLIIGVSVMILSFASSLGVESIDETITQGKMLFKLLVFSTGWVGFTLGGLKKYLLFEKQ